MYRGKSILCVVPARGGSKGIKKKNIRLVLGEPLIKYTLDFIKSLDFIDKVCISTDSKEIKSVVESLGFEVPFLRSKLNSGDLASDYDVVDEVVKKIEKTSKTKYDIVLLMQPTSPQRYESQIISTLDKLILGSFDSVWTVSKAPVKYHPLKQLVIKDDKLFYYESLGSNIIARQQLNDTYIRNGVCYAVKVDAIYQRNSLFTKKTSFIIVQEDSFNIDEVEDIFKFEEFLLSINHVK
jgi:CMP-N,N'-diacetyllegionaminic acid synthase